jgi:hypothetical protein
MIDMSFEINQLQLIGTPKQMRLNLLINKFFKYFINFKKVFDMTVK